MVPELLNRSITQVKIFMFKIFGCAILCAAQKTLHGLWVLVHGFCISRKGEDGWSHPQGAVHMTADRRGCKGALVPDRPIHPACIWSHRRKLVMRSKLLDLGENFC